MPLQTRGGLTRPLKFSEYDALVNVVNGFVDGTQVVGGPIVDARSFAVGGVVTTQSVIDAIASIPDGGTVLLPEEVSFGTTPLTITAKSLCLKGLGKGYQDSNYGTRITYTGTGCAIRLCSASAQAYAVVLQDFDIYGGSNWSSVYGDIAGGPALTGGGGGIQIGSSTAIADNFGIGSLRIENVSVQKMSGPGLLFAAINWGVIINSDFNYNERGISASVVLQPNNVVSFINCRMQYNTQEGVYAEHAGGWEFFNCDASSNGYEGMKFNALSGLAVDGMRLRSGWFELNQVDAARTNGYYNLLVTGSSRYAGQITLDGVHFRGVTGQSTDGGATGNSPGPYIYAASVTIQNTSWASYGPTYIRPWGYVDGGTLAFAGEQYEAWTWSKTTRVESGFGPFIQTVYDVNHGFYTNATTNETTLGNIYLLNNRFSDYEQLTTSDPTVSSYRNGGIFSLFKIQAKGKSTGTSGTKLVQLYWSNVVIGNTVQANNTNQWEIESTVLVQDVASNDVMYVTRTIDGTNIILNEDRTTVVPLTSNVLVKVTGTCSNTDDKVINYFLTVKPGG